MWAESHLSCGETVGFVRILLKGIYSYKCDVFQARRNELAYGAKVASLPGNVNQASALVHLASRWLWRKTPKMNDETI